MIAVLICDDHPVVLDGIGRLVEAHPDCNLDGSFPGLSGLMQFLADRPAPAQYRAVLLLDIHLKDGDGIDFCSVIKADSPGVGIIGFSSLEEPAVIATMLRKGASSFLLKSASSDQIMEAIRETDAGRSYLSPEITRMMLEFNLGKTERNDYLPKLSRREKEVLAMIVQEHTTKEIADSLFISANTVETHRNNLLQKLNARNVAGLVRIAIEKGLV